MEHYDSIHPPNVVLVNSTEASPDHNPTEEQCSPLSTAPNSPYRVSYEEDDDDDDDDEVRPEEIQELLDTPVSSKRNLRGHVGEVPFDEGGGGTPKRMEAEPIDPLLGNPRLHKRETPVVSPMVLHEDIDAYEDEEEEDDRHNDSDEKKEESLTPPPSSRPPMYSANHSEFSSSKARDYLHRGSGVACGPGVPPTMSEDTDTMPHDELQFRKSSPDKEDDADHNEGRSDQNEDHHSPMKEALQSAERDLQEMERRVQEMIQQRRNSIGSNSQQQQQRFETEDQEATEAEHVEADASPDEMQPLYEADEADPIIRITDVYEIEGEPPSLSPHRDVHSSMESSYYYDGSAIESDDANNTTLESISSSALGGTTTRVGMSIHPPLGETTASDNYYSRLSSSRSASAMETSREETTTSSSTDVPRYSARMDSSATSSHYERFASLVDQEASSGSFANLVSGTSRAINQVTDDLANFLVLPPSEPRRPSSQKRSKKYNPPSEQEYPPISPSQDSESTPHIGNLSPRRGAMDGGAMEQEDDVDLLYRQRPSAKLAKARSLVSVRQKSPTTAPYLQRSSSSNSNREDPKEKARQVMTKREQERPSSSSKARRDRGSRRNADPMNIPVPPTLYRIAAMMGGGSGCEDGEENEAAGRDGGDADWLGFMEEYQKNITESLRNLSLDEISGLAQNGEQAKNDPEFGNDTMVSPGMAVSPSRDKNRGDINKFSNLKKEEYDALVQEMTFGACLQMPQLDHPPIQTTRNTSTTQRPTDTNDYGQGVAGVLQYNEYNYQSSSDETQRPQLGEDPEHLERAVFAKQLSERLLNLDPMDSMDSEDRRSTPQKPNTKKAENELSFVSKESPSSFVMSPPKRGGDANKDSMTDVGESPIVKGGLFVSNMPQDGDLPRSGQSSDGLSNSKMASPDSDIRASKSQAKSTGPSSIKSGESIADIKPTMVESIDNETGIAKGDVMLSLLCDNSFQSSKEKPDSWNWRVREAIWRGRSMRRDRSQTAFNSTNSQGDGDERELRRSSSLPVDVDDVRVVGGIKNVASIQEKALLHLERDEFEQALELYEDIIFNYYSFFEQVLAKRDELSTEDVSVELSNFKPYIGASLHNLGVIHLLKGDFEDAFSFFKRAVDNRRNCLGEDHPDCVTSLVRLATCRFAMDNFADAHTNLELSLALAGSKARTTNDYSQLGEILNNLGCLSYMCGQPTKAMKLFRESLDVQLAVLNSTLYGGSKFSAHTATLNISITRGNIGFLALVLRDVSSGILALEAALREQRLLLTGAHVTLVSTMDHLAVANLLDGRTQKAIKMLRRIYELQSAAYGSNDRRCSATRQKILTIRGQQQKEDINRDIPPSVGQQQPYHAEEEASHSRHDVEQVSRHQQQSNAEGKQFNKQAGQVTSSNSNPPGGASGKVNSVFKAIRSLGRKKEKN